MASGGSESATLLQQQEEACNRMMTALHDVIRQEQEVRRRVEVKKQKLAELQQQQDSGTVHSSEVERKQKQLSLLNGEIEDLELAYRYQMAPAAHIQLPPEMEIVPDNVPPPLPPRYNTSNRVSSKLKDVGPEQWLCVYCNTVNSDLMPLCANCSK